MVWVPALAGVIVLCSNVFHLTLTEPHPVVEMGTKIGGAGGGRGGGRDFQIVLSWFGNKWCTV